MGPRLREDDGGIKNAVRRERDGIFGSTGV